MKTTFEDRFGIYPLDWSENETCVKDFDTKKPLFIGTLLVRGVKS